MPRAACTLLLLLHASLAVLLPPLPTYAMHKPRGVLSAASDADPWRRTLTEYVMAAAATRRSSIGGGTAATSSGGGKAKVDA
jgi:hypothetical protein